MFSARSAAPLFASLLLAGFGFGLPTQALGADASALPVPPEYEKVQKSLARGWNTWDVDSVATQVLLPAGLALHVGLRHNGPGENRFLSDVFIGRLRPEEEQVFPGPHSWDGSYTELRISWMGHAWRLQSAHDGSDLVLLARPLTPEATSAHPPTLVVVPGFLWNRPGAIRRRPGLIEARSASGTIPIFCAVASSRVEARDSGEGGFSSGPPQGDWPAGGPYFAVSLTQPVGLSTGKPRPLAEIEALVERQRRAYGQSLSACGRAAPAVDAIETTLGWDTIFEPTGGRVLSPVSRLWSRGWGGYILFEWDGFFAATMAAVGDRDLAYANAIEDLREETREGFVPNYAAARGRKSSDRSEPPVGSLTVLGLYRKFHDRWLLEEAFPPLLRWNRWWSRHRDLQGYLTWGSDGENQPEDLADPSRGTRQGAIYESGLDNSPMYDGAVYDPGSHLLEFADVGLMSLYVADCDALGSIADVLGKTAEARELRDRSARYKAKLQTLWNDRAGIFLNKDLRTGRWNTRLSPTNFYPLLARAATPAQAEIMVRRHLLNPDEFWTRWPVPSIARNDPAFRDQNYWRGRVWAPMNYLVYLGLRGYGYPEVRRQFAERSFELFQREWREKGHVHENYNAISGIGDDVTSSDRFYHWGALLAYIELLEQTQPTANSQTGPGGP